MSYSRIPSLDGLRAISILLVLISHSLPYRTVQLTGDLGNLGVRFFFVISGFLITSLLLSELEKTGRISLKDFYIRRAFRIFPAFYAFLALMWLSANLGWIQPLDSHSLVRAATYTINYVPAAERDWNLGHIWSLAVEEQFYLLWPAVVCFAGKRNAFRVALATVVLVPLVRLGTYEYFPALRTGIKWQFQTVCDSIAIGCVYAFGRARLSENRLYNKWLPYLFWPAVAIAAATNQYMAGRPRFSALIGQSIINGCLLLCMDRVTRFPESATGPFLNWKPVTFLGVMSYSVYLWQQPFFKHLGGPWWLQPPVNWALIVSLASLSYAWIERPCLALRSTWCSQRRYNAEARRIFRR